MDESKLNKYIDDVIYHLEDKIKLNIETDEEYGFYIEYRVHGDWIFEKEEYLRIILRLINELDIWTS